MESKRFNRSIYVEVGEGINTSSSYSILDENTVSVPVAHYDPYHEIDFTYYGRDEWYPNDAPLGVMFLLKVKEEL